MKKIITHIGHYTSQQLLRCCALLLGLLPFYTPPSHATPAINLSTNITPEQTLGNSCAPGKCGKARNMNPAHTSRSTHNNPIKAYDGCCGLSGQGLNKQQTAKADVLAGYDNHSEGTCSDSLR